ncbi:MAG: phage N-6-adenine-methyltransferase [Bacteroidales bacterium]|nr:phage N-6-adenine-methyltransferase [Bacteroidales bacterium]
MDTRQQKNATVSTDDWYTPQWIIDKLGPFDLDPCAAPESVRPYETANICLTKDDNGLSHKWAGIVWMNPPYSCKLLRQFCERMAQHGNGMALLVNRQDNLLWQEVIFTTAKSMLFMRHRVKFIRPDGTTGSPFFGSCLVAWGDECDRRLRQSNIEGKYVVLNV